MERSLSSPHQVVNPAALARPSGFSHVVVSAPGRTVYLAGQAAQLPDGRMAPGGIAEQFDVAAANIVKALVAAGARPEHLVSMQIFTTDLKAYRDALAQLGAVYRKHFGRHYPAVSLFEVSGLFDPEAKIEIVCIAVVPEPPAGGLSEKGRGR